MHPLIAILMLLEWALLILILVSACMRGAMFLAIVTRGLPVLATLKEMAFLLGTVLWTILLIEIALLAVLLAYMTLQTSKHSLSGSRPRRCPQPIPRKARASS
ncbi:unnamed protein product [Prorocentrum cordatum]|uniref:Uncharacterized protein n=1 Tax=Prorocentrum cordatum TaxID=2364126 RepID=A0ABN9WMB6_9DINO|nr:unnamed protein product [Polarella glacialis]